MGNSELSSETMWAFELGYRAQVTRKLSLDTALFFDQYDSVIAVESRPVVGPTAVGFLLPSPFYNDLSGPNYGGEVAFTWAPVKIWQLRGAYSLLLSNLGVNFENIAAAERPLLKSQAIAFARNSPRNQVDLRSEWTLPHRVSFDLIGRFVDELSGFDINNVPGIQDRIPSYFSLDTRVAWCPRKNFQLELVGQNLLQDHHLEFGTSFALRTPLAQPERSGYLRLTFKF